MMGKRDCSLYFTPNGKTALMSHLRYTFKGPHTQHVLNTVGFCLLPQIPAVLCHTKGIKGEQKCETRKYMHQIRTVTGCTSARFLPEAAFLSSITCDKPHTCAASDRSDLIHIFSSLTRAKSLHSFLRPQSYGALVPVQDGNLSPHAG